MNTAIPHTAPATTTRAQAQRERILAAAQTCFIEHGFHAASMASIAETAEMSAGLIYRYFENKSAIILAIIERHLAFQLSEIGKLYGSRDLAADLMTAFERWRGAQAQHDHANAALLLEMTAQATREPPVAAALHAADRASATAFESWLARSPAEGGLGLGPQLAKQRAVLIRCLFEGLMVRAIREPDLDPDVLRAALAEILPGLLSR